MNLLGKILVMVIFIESLAFMFFAMSVYSTHTNWRDEAAALKQDLDAEVADNRSLNTQLERLRSDLDQEKIARQDALTSLEVAVDEHRNEVATLTTQLEELQGQNREAVAAMRANEQTLSSLRQEATGLREQIRQVNAEKDGFFDQMVLLTDTLNQKVNELDLLNERNMELLEQTGRMTQVLHRNNLSEFDQELPPKVDGIIERIGEKGQLIEISLGHDDGLRQGHTLEVFRLRNDTSKYLGRVEVLKTEPNRAVAKVIPEFRKARFQVSDRVATRLN